MVVAPRVAGQRHVVLVHVDGHAELAARLLGEAEVVEVRVRQHHGRDVSGLAAELLQRVMEGLP